MKTIVAAFMLLGSFTLVRASENLLVMETPVPAVVYNAPVTYTAPVVYTQPVVYNAPVTYAPAVYTPVVYNPDAAWSSPAVCTTACDPVSPNVIISGRCGVTSYYSSIDTTPNVLIVRSGQGCQRVSPCNSLGRFNSAGYSPCSQPTRAYSHGGSHCSSKASVPVKVACRK